MAQIVVPAVCEPLLAGRADAARLAVIIDLLSGAAGQGAGAGSLNFHMTSAGAANGDPTNIANAPANLVGFDMGNKAAYWVYVKLYDQAGSPVAADTPTRVISLPPGGGVARPVVQSFANKMWVRMVKGAADNDNTLTVAGDVTMSVDYKLQ